MIVYITMQVDWLCLAQSSAFFLEIVMLIPRSPSVVIASALHLVILVIDNRRRGKKAVWLWRMVARSNGRYIVAK